MRLSHWHAATAALTLLLSLGVAVPANAQRGGDEGYGGSGNEGYGGGGDEGYGGGGGDGFGDYFGGSGLRPEKEEPEVAEFERAEQYPHMDEDQRKAYDRLGRQLKTLFGREQELPPEIREIFAKTIQQTSYGIYKPPTEEMLRVAEGIMVFTKQRSLPATHSHRIVGGAGEVLGHEQLTLDNLNTYLTETRKLLDQSTVPFADRRELVDNLEKMIKGAKRDEDKLRKKKAREAADKEAAEAKAKREAEKAAEKAKKKAAGRGGRGGSSGGSDSGGRGGRSG